MGPYRFNLRDCLLETALGSVKALAMHHGDSITSLPIWDITQRLKAMRSPEVVALLEAKRLRRAQAETAGA